VSDELPDEAGERRINRKTPPFFAGRALMVSAFLALCVVGVGRDQFGQPLVFTSPGPYLFFGSIWLAAFGLAYTFVSARLTCGFMVCISAIYRPVFIAEKASRGEL
jgi:hypothetical protein